MAKITSLIIGGTGGIGADISRRLGSLGHNLIVHGRDEIKLDAFAGELMSLGAPGVLSICRNLDTRADIEKLVDDCLPVLKKVDVLIIGFGPLCQASIEEMRSRDIIAMIDMNLLLPSLLISKFAPAMKSRGGGSIVLFGGTGSDQNRAYRKIAVYSSAKYGLNSLVRSASAEFAFSGVRINLISPGYVETEYYDQKFRNLYKNSGKLLEPKRISDIVEFLISEKAVAINGALINAGSGQEW